MKQSQESHSSAETNQRATKRSGIGNLHGFALGGMVLGVVETYAGGMSGISTYRDGIAFAHDTKHTNQCGPSITETATSDTCGPRRNISMENFISLGKAIDDAGGSAFVILERFKPLLEILEANSISIKAKHEPSAL